MRSDPYPPGSGSAGWLKGRSDAGSSRMPLRLVSRAHTIWQSWCASSLSGLLSTFLLVPGFRLPSTSLRCCDSTMVQVSHLHSIKQRLVAHVVGHPPLIRPEWIVPPPANVIRVPGHLGIGHSGDCASAASAYTAEASDVHQLLHPVPPPLVASTVNGLPQLAGSVETPVSHPQGVQGVGIVGISQLMVGEARSHGPDGLRGLTGHSESPAQSAQYRSSTANLCRY